MLRYPVVAAPFRRSLLMAFGLAGLKGRDVTLQQDIEAKVRASLAPTHLEVINESHMHSVPPGSESHFRLVVVSERFEGQALVRRHRTVNGVLAAELDAGLHALSLQTLTPSEWARRGGHTASSPPCLGGSKATG